MEWNTPTHREPFFDYLVGLEGQALDPSINLSAANGSNPGAPVTVTPEQQARIEAAGADVWRSLERREGSVVTLNVWNSKRQEFREVPVVPSRQWSTPSSATTSGKSQQQQQQQQQPSLLGLSLRLCDPSQALSAVWHILDILEGSPAALAGLVPYGDYVIGWAGAGGRGGGGPDRASVVPGAGGGAGNGSGAGGGGGGADDAVPPLRGEGDFYELVERYTNRPLRLYVYNSDFDHTREVIIIPNRDWGGEGLLGCGVGYGLLHRIPRPQERIAPSALPSSLTSAGSTATPPPPSQSAAAAAAAMAASPSSKPAAAGVRNSILGGVGGLNETVVEEEDEDEEDEESGDGGGGGGAAVTVSVRPDEEE
ncbi:hypothetical protein OC842_002570 [Tilletia horrida]|uniref:PDZ GRASP-type domain-containing protein n=1 Tax=Tilletia horrida TaxID=155126 RepID=A0AAN6GEE1_9BASI|nr:hypothetical protein OC842_002570 [Tilletia horrida]